MRKRIADHVREQVKASYGSIAHAFSETRKTPWPEFDSFLTHFPSPSKELKVLDLGCGNGRLFDFLRPWSADYVGVDNSIPLLQKARERFPEAQFQLGDMARLELPDNCFDVAFAIASFHHLPSRWLREQSLAEIRRVLKQDGLLILTVWNLFQSRFWLAWMGALFSFAFHLGTHYAWNDLWVPWGDFPLKRYYHAFLPRELLRHFSHEGWKVEDFYYTRKGKRVPFLKSFNLCLVVRKTHGKTD